MGLRCKAGGQSDGFMARSHVRIFEDLSLVFHTDANSHTKKMIRFHKQHTFSPTKFILEKEISWDRSMKTKFSRNFPQIIWL